MFIGWIALLYQLPLQLFFTFWGGGFLGALTLPLFPKGSHISFLLFGGIAFFGFPLVAYFGKRLNYSRTEYKFFDDRLEFEEGFFTQNRKVIRYKDVKEITLHKGLFQRMYGLGSVYLATLATGSVRGPNVFGALGFGNVSASGVTVRDIRDPDATYDRIRRFVDAHA
ncbi:MAG TPA: PH domain-containing protein [Rhizomicrobium sp.]|nr:PH domain-containing protein [Rhizomicrobium sp.]